MASDRIRTGQVIAQRYRIERQLGKGGMGSVFLVTHVHTDEQLALKVLHSASISDTVALERFRREARTPARIQSDHVVRVTDADVAEELGDAPFLVMEYLRGEDLEQRSTRLGPLQPEEVVVYLHQAARALDKAHVLGIVHRDLKPENLFLTTREDGTPCVKILDYGIAKLTGEASRQLSRAAATSTGQVFGTPLYMAPEQAKGEASKISPQTDIWALGLIAHRLLTGTEIWTAETIAHLIAQIAYEPMPVPSEHGASFGQAYDDWFAVCCARDVEKRHQTAGEAIRALGRALDIEDSYIGMARLGPMIDVGTGRFQIAVPSSDPAVSAMKAADLAAMQHAATLTDTPGPLAPSSSSPASRPSPAPTPLKSSSGALTRSTDMRVGDASARRVRLLGIAAVVGLSAAALSAGAVWWSTSGAPSPASHEPAAPNSAAMPVLPPLPPVIAPSPAVTTLPAPTPQPSAALPPAPSTGAGVAPPPPARASTGPSGGRRAGIAPPARASTAPGTSAPPSKPAPPHASAAPVTSAPPSKPAPPHASAAPGTSAPPSKPAPPPADNKKAPTAPLSGGP